MSSSSDTLRFSFPTHGDSILSRINTLREEQLFCDVTLLLGGSPGATVRPFHFHGHRAVLAASSDFLRDQFLLHKGQAELSVGVVSSVEAGRRLLLSCYTGLLEVPLTDLVSYLTAASALQMSQVVEKCSQAISQYLSPTAAFLKAEKHSENKIQQTDSNWLCTSFGNHEERDAAQPGAYIQEASRVEAGAVVIQSKRSRFSQGTVVKGQGPREVADDQRVVIAGIELSENTAGCLDSVESEPSHQAHQCFTSALRELHPPIAVQDHISSTTRGSAPHKELEDGSQEEDVFLLAAQLQECGDLLHFSEAHLPKNHCAGDELKEGSDILIQRPYLCRRCDRVFQHLESYVGHLKEHRQHWCLVCGEGFSQRSNLTRHIGVHSGIKPFRCPLCHRMFSHRATLQDHLNVHTGTKPHECKYCALHFSHKPGLRRHLKDVHGKSSLPNMLEEAVHS